MVQNILKYRQFCAKHSKGIRFLSKFLREASERYHISIQNIEKVYLIPTKLSKKVFKLYPRLLQSNWIWPKTLEKYLFLIQTMRQLYYVYPQKPKKVSKFYTKYSKTIWFWSESLKKFWYRPKILERYLILVQHFRICTPIIRKLS